MTKEKQKLLTIVSPNLQVEQAPIRTALSSEIYY